MKNRGEDITWCLRDRLTTVRPPLVMGILNITPDSFHADSRKATVDAALRTAEQMLADGASIIDIGGASTRPGAHEVPLDEERARIVPVITAIHQRFPGVCISIDTWRSTIAAEAVAAGASMVNDIGAGLLDEAMLDTVATLQVPYVIMHMQGTPRTMQKEPKYKDVLAEVLHFLSVQARAARQAGIADVIIDPGFGFGKDKTHNFTLLKGLPALKTLGVPVLAGLSRKRMINEVLGTTPAEALNGTTVLNVIALIAHADILRVHDVNEAMQAVKL
ncbi:MAG: dihydropteroate synthase, partial [Flavobacteriales bacterium]